jgi:hypothetical protein
MSAARLIISLYSTLASSICLLYYKKRKDHLVQPSQEIIIRRSFDNNEQHAYSKRHNSIDIGVMDRAILGTVQ